MGKWIPWFCFECWAFPNLRNRNIWLNLGRLLHSMGILPEAICFCDMRNLAEDVAEGMAEVTFSKPDFLKGEEEFDEQV